jgi:hypothetical protein
MAKTFITSGTGASQTLDAIQNEKVPVYNTRADAEADLANLEEGQIVATKDTGATEKVVDVVEDGNMNPVTSNGVFDFAFDKSKIRMGEVTGGSPNNDNWVATFDTPFPDSNYGVIITPLSDSGASKCPNGWYVVATASTGFSIYCNGNAPNAFQYIAIHR